MEYIYSPPPCAPGTSIIGNVRSPETRVYQIPPGGGSPGSSLGMIIEGFDSDASSPTGYSYFQVRLPLSAFARSETVSALAAQLSSLASTNTDLTTSVVAIQNQLQSFATSLDLSALQSTVTAQGASINGLNVSMSSVQSTLGTHGSDIAALQSTVGSQGTALSTLTTSVSALSSTVSAQGSALSVLQTNLGAISGNVSSLQSATTNLQSSVSALNANFAAVNAQLSGIDVALTDIDNRLDALESIPAALVDLGVRIDDARQSADEGTAMAAAMTSMAPTEGKSNRLGINSAIYNDTTAVALNYTRVSGPVDLNVGVAVAGGSTMAKAGVGFSW